MLPLAIYIHWPFCASKCPYCDFNSHVREKVDQAAMREALLAELRHFAQFVPQRKVASIFFGGGTPSLMPPATAGALIDEVARLWQVEEEMEITLEANPTSVEAAAFAGFRAAGVNRASLGVQALNGKDLAFLGRKHSPHEALAAVGLAAQYFSRYSFDLIYARPEQTPEMWEKELHEALRYADGHMSLYQLTIEPGTAFHAAYAKGEFVLPDEESAARMFELTEEIMRVRSFGRYEISNHAKPGQESRHNLAYWRGEDYIGVGAGAHGRLTVEGVRIATETAKSPEIWLAKTQREGHATIAHTPLAKREHIEELVMMGLRVAEGISLSRFKTQAGVGIGEAVQGRKLAQYIEQGLLARDEEHLRATPAGMLVLNRLVGELLGG